MVNPQRAKPKQQIVKVVFYLVVHRLVDFNVNDVIPDERRCNHVDGQLEAHPLPHACVHDGVQLVVYAVADAPLKPDVIPDHD